MTLKLSLVADIIISSSKEELAPNEVPDSVDSKSHSLIFSLQNHQDVYDTNALSLSLIADLMGIDYYEETYAKELIDIIKFKLSLTKIKPTA